MTRTYMFPANVTAKEINDLARKGFIVTSMCHVPTLEYNKGLSMGMFLVTCTDMASIASTLASAIRSALSDDLPSVVSEPIDATASASNPPVASTSGPIDDRP